MKFSFSSEQEAFRTGVRRFLTDRSPTKEVRRLMQTEAGWDADGWKALNSELGLCAVRIPESMGGHGFGFSEHCIVLEEMGRALLAGLCLLAVATRWLGRWEGSSNSNCSSSNKSRRQPPRLCL